MATKTIQFNLSPFLEFDSRLLNKGWNTDFIIAGEFLSNTLANIKPKYLDFYIFTEKGFHILLDFFNHTYHTYSIKTSYYIKINNGKIRIRLFNAFNTQAIDIINNMEADIFACYYDGENIHLTPTCEETIDTGIIRHTKDSKKCCASTIITAIDNGYKITREILEAVWPNGVANAVAKRPQPPGDISYLVTSEEYNEIMNDYEYELFDYLQTVVDLIDDDYYELCKKAQEKHHTQSQSVIEVHDVEIVKQLLLPYVLKHSILEQITEHTNYNAGYGSPVNVNEMIEWSLQAKQSQEQAKQSQEQAKQTQSQGQAKQQTYPPAPKRPLPVLPKQHVE